MKSAKEMEEAILKAKSEGDSVGGIIECTALNVPVGVGEPLFDSLDADVAKMLFNVPAVKGVEFGTGFEAARLRGSENNDPFAIRDEKIVTLTNNAGGVLGGLSSGMPIVVRAAIKPTPSISKEQKTIDLSKMEETTIKVMGRHDPCVVPKAVPVIESAVAIVLADHMLRANVIPKVLKGA
jgi:chorismate synthase